MRSILGFILGAVVAYTGGYIIAQEVPVDNVEVVPEVRIYDDGKPDDSYAEKVYKSATSTPEFDSYYFNDQILQKLDRIEQKMDLIIKRK